MSMKSGIIFVIDTIDWLVHLDNLFFKRIFKHVYYYNHNLHRRRRRRRRRIHIWYKFRNCTVLYLSLSFCFSVFKCEYVFFLTLISMVTILDVQDLSFEVMNFRLSVKLGKTYSLISDPSRNYAFILVV